jgi:hypothetical protein
MGFLEGKSATEKKKIIAAGVLGLVALVALYLAFGRSFIGGSSTTATAKVTPTPGAASKSTDKSDTVMPTASEQDIVYQSTAIDYRPGSSGAPEPGRNIFAFRDPDPPCPACPVITPPPPPMKTPTLAPTPEILIAGINNQSVYAGSKGFRLEVTGDHFTPDSQIYFNQSVMPTTFFNQQKLVTDISANLIAQEGSRQVIVQTPDGKKYSNQVMMSVQAPPRPSVQYIGMIGRKRYNNDTAYFTEGEKSSPFGARLNDIVNNRFRLIAIAPAEVTFQDVDLGFKHRVSLTRQAGGGMPGAAPGRGGSSPNDSNFAPFDSTAVPAGDIPGIPSSMQRHNANPAQPGQPSMMAVPQKKDKKDVDDNGDDDN